VPSKSARSSNTGGFFAFGAFMQPIETVEEFEQLAHQIDFSDREPIVVEVDEEDAMEAFDQSH
jgi:hypothetical protein